MHVSTGNEPCDTVRLTFEARCKSRLLLRLDSGEMAALIVERGRSLRGGDRVRIEDGRTIEIIAVEEALLEALSDDPVALAKAAYHLGNRHVAVQVMPGRLRFLNDHVLGEMVKGLGLQVVTVLAVFDPEGAPMGTITRTAARYRWRGRRFTSFTGETRRARPVAAVGQPSPADRRVQPLARLGVRHREQAGHR